MSARQFFFRLSAELIEINEADLRVNILARDDREILGVKITGIDKDSEDNCLRVEDEDGDEFYIMMRNIISLVPVAADEEEDEDDGTSDEDEEEDGTAEENA